MKPLHCLALGLGLVAACDTGGNMVASTPDPLVSHNTVPASPHAVLYGNVVVQPLEVGRVAVVLDGGMRRDASDGLADEVFLLQSDNSRAPWGPLRVRDATLSYRGSSLVVADAENVVLTFAVAGKGSLANEPLFSRGAQTQASWEGYGLSRRIGLPTVRMRGLTAARLLPFLPPCPSSRNAAVRFSTVVADSLVCSSGGPGSTNCSTSCIEPPYGCSVTCGAGYYSCCDAERCKCQCKKA